MLGGVEALRVFSRLTCLFGVTRLFLTRTSRAREKERERERERKRESVCVCVCVQRKVYARACARVLDRPSVDEVVSSPRREFSPIGGSILRNL